MDDENLNDPVYFQIPNCGQMAGFQSVAADTIGVRVAVHDAANREILLNCSIRLEHDERIAPTINGRLITGPFPIQVRQGDQIGLVVTQN